MKIKTQYGQAVLESLLSLGVFLLLAVTGVIVSLGALEKIIVIRAAAAHSRCLAEETPPKTCEENTLHNLERHHPLKLLQVDSKTIKGTIYTEVTALFLKRIKIQGRFGLLPIEYKRVSN